MTKLKTLSDREVEIEYGCSYPDKEKLKSKGYIKQDVKEAVKELKEQLDIVLISEADKYKANVRINKIFGDLK